MCCNNKSICASQMGGADRINFEKSCNSGIKMCLPKNGRAAFLGQSLSAHKTSAATRNKIVSGQTLSAAEYNKLPAFLQRNYNRKAQSRAVASNNNDSKWGSWDACS